MELLDLQAPDYGVHSTGIYIIDDDGVRVCAGPFESEAAAIVWIIRRRGSNEPGRSTARVRGSLISADRSGGPMLPARLCRQ